MKLPQFILFIAICASILSCAPNQNRQSDTLFGATWQLEYITGPRIAFDGLFPNKKPQITFNAESKQVEGNDSCNGYRAEFTRNGPSISFGDPGPTTLMFCGEGEQVFLNTMKKIDQYKIDTDEKLILLMNDVPMMRFHKVGDE